MEERLSIFRNFLQEKRDHSRQLFAMLPDGEHRQTVLMEIAFLDDIIHHYDIFVKRSLELSHDEVAD